MARRKADKKFAPSSTQPMKLFLFTAVFLIGIALYVLSARYFTGSGKTAIGTKLYKGSKWRTEQTVKARPVVATEFGSCEMHTVRTEDGKLVHDWLWWDEYDQVNVIVHMADGNDFTMFRQRKYGLEGDTIAPVGGLINPDETPLQAAQRELREELGYESSNWVSLGRFRTSSTRGGGFLNAFLALDSKFVDGVTKENFKDANDLEAHEQIRMNQEGLRQAMMAGEIQEVKWTATVALALEWLRKNRG
mmetsp:Transcript_15813/g.20886  ORF Transcript_15813/g.20886 Transcript_15813/m.20886 type:complete len:248 (+) Transcript_15813:105-848(+)